MDWFHTINPVINWKNYLISLECRGEIVRILGTKYGYSHAYVEVCALRLVLKMMQSEKILAWFGVLQT